MWARMLSLKDIFNLYISLVSTCYLIFMIFRILYFFLNTKDLAHSNLFYVEILKKQKNLKVGMNANSLGLLELVHICGSPL